MPGRPRRNPEEPAVFPVNLGRPLGLREEGFDVVESASYREGHRVLGEQPRTLAFNFRGQGLQPAQRGGAADPRAARIASPNSSSRKVFRIATTR
jgi:hypothetical protein